MKITQEAGESVLNYRLRFEELASWSGFNDDSLLAHVKKGLHSKILTVMYNSSTEVKNLNELWERAMSIELNLKEQERIQRTTSGNYYRRFKTRPANNNNKQEALKATTENEYPYHYQEENLQNEENEQAKVTRSFSRFRQDRYDRRECFHCGKTGHRIKDCPELRRGGNNNPQRQKAKVTRETTGEQEQPLEENMEQAHDSGNTTEEQYAKSVRSEGLFYLPGKIIFPDKRLITVNALIDSAASSQYIDPSFVDRYKLPRIPLKIPIRLSNADGSSNNGGILTHKVTIPLQLGRSIYPTDFTIARMGNDNLVLGLEWMKIFNPAIDWKKRT